MSPSTAPAPARAGRPAVTGAWPWQDKRRYPLNTSTLMQSGGVLWGERQALDCSRMIQEVKQDARQGCWKDARKDVPSWRAASLDASILSIHRFHVSTDLRGPEATLKLNTRQQSLRRRACGRPHGRSLRCSRWPGLAPSAAQQCSPLPRQCAVTFSIPRVAAHALLVFPASFALVYLAVAP